MYLEENKKRIAEGELFESLIKHPGWDLFKAKLEQKRQSLLGKYSNVVTNLDQLNFDNGQRRGLEESLSIVQKTIDLKQEALKEIEDAQEDV